MPKEVIRGTLFKGSFVSVGWSKEHGDAQLGVSLGSQFVFVDKDRNPQSEWQSPVTLENADVYEGLYFTFDSRDQINELIRNLRKARDSAFGKDE